MDNGYNVREEYKHLETETLRIEHEKDRLGFSVMALNITGDLNVGMLIRSAANLGAKEAHILGRRRIDRRSLVGTQNYITIHRVAALTEDGLIDPEAFVSYSLNKNIVLVEQGGIPINEVSWRTEPWNTDPCFVFGNEGEGIHQSLLELSYPVVSIPQRGVMRSFNVAATASIVMWDYAKDII